MRSTSRSFRNRSALVVLVAVGTTGVGAMCQRAPQSYILLCQLRDSVGALSHAVLGMFKVLQTR